MIDKHVRAEIPDPQTNPRLHEIVLKHMIHGPCGELNPNSPCMIDGKCSKRFPKEFQNETNGNVNGYPQYQRRDTNISYSVRNHPIDNRWVVPYSPYLSLEYNCHVNVEVCASIKSVKYLFKYVYKGHDCANIEITEQVIEHNEVKSFIDSRYVSAPEAMWRLLGFKMHDQSHTVIRLTVHLEDEQSVVFNANQVEQAVADAEFRNSTLMAWFKLNSDYH